MTEETLLYDLVECAEEVTAHNIAQPTWIKHHIFYGNVGTIGVKGQNRGRCPFVRIYEGLRDYEQQTISTIGGSFNTNYVIEFVVNTKSVSSQFDNFSLAKEMWKEFLAELNTKDNFLDSRQIVEELQVNPSLFVLRATITVRNSYGG